MGRAVSYIKLVLRYSNIAISSSQNVPLSCNIRRAYSSAARRYSGGSLPQMPVVYLCRVSRSKLLEFLSIKSSSDGFALAISRYATGKTLKDVLPFSFQGNSNIPKDADIAQVNAAFEELSKDPMWQYTALDEKSLGDLKYDGIKGDDTDTASLLEYAKLGVSDVEGLSVEKVQLKDKSGLTDTEAIYAFVSLKDQDS